MCDGKRKMCVQVWTVGNQEMTGNAMQTPNCCCMLLFLAFTLKSQYSDVSCNAALNKSNLAY